jgi:hypothetical protein
VTQIRQYKAGNFYRDEFRGNLSWNGNEHNVLLRNEGRDRDGTLKFADVAMAMGADDVKDARGMAIADFDNDGDYDVVINTNPGDCGQSAVPPVLLRNDLGQQRHWLAVKLWGSTCNCDAVGAQVTLRYTNNNGQPVQMLRQVSAGGGYASQNSDRLYFGLNDASDAESLTVVWPSGKQQTFYGISADRLLEIEEEGGVRELPETTPWQLTQRPTL